LHVEAGYQDEMISQVKTNYELIFVNSVTLGPFEIKFGGLFTKNFCLQTS
jgi:hypothetical protein